MEEKQIEINILEKGNHKVISLVGEVDLYSVSNLRKEIMKSVDEGGNSIIVDMSKLNYMDSSGIALMANLQRKIKASGGQFALLGLNDEVKNVLKLAALDKFFTIYETEDQLP